MDIQSSKPNQEKVKQNTPTENTALETSGHGSCVEKLTLITANDNQPQIETAKSTTSIAQIIEPIKDSRLSTHPITSKERIIWDRSQFLGGSDLGAILGLSTFRSAVDVWLEKTQGTGAQADSLIFRFGHFAEDFIAQEYERVTAHTTHKEELALTHHQYPYLKGHVDRWVTESKKEDQSNDGPSSRILECKTSHPQQAHLWGEPGSDQVPMAYYVQCAWYMMLANCSICDVAVLIGNNDFRIYTLNQDPELEKFLLETAVHFWEQHVLTKTAPEPISEDDCRKLYPKSEPSKKTEASANLLKEIQHLHEIQTIIKEKEAMASEIKQLIMNTLKDADTLTYQGKTLATWKAPKPSIKTNYKQLELDHPEWVIPYQSPQENSRRLLIKELS
jgi:putative phage-type endonuclease